MRISVFGGIDATTVSEVTARVQAKYLPEDHEVQIVSRAVTEMRVTVPRQWVPVVLNWNGVPLEKLDTPGCRLLSIVKALQNAAACPEPARRARARAGTLTRVHRSRYFTVW